MTVLRQRGARIPDDVAVIGFDDVPLAAEVDPPLTTVHVPLPEIGALAATRLLEMLDGPDGAPARDEVVPATLVRRASA